MNFTKVSRAQALLRHLREKQAGVMLPLAAGAAIVGSTHAIHKGFQKGREYEAGFQPGYIPGSQK